MLEAKKNFIFKITSKTFLSVSVGLLAFWIIITTYPDIYLTSIFVFPFLFFYFGSNINIKSEKIKLLIIRVILASGVICVLIAFINSLYFPGLKFNWASPLVNPNLFAGFLLLILPLSINLFLYSKNFLYLTSSIIMTLGLFFTFSRGGWIGFLIAMIILILALVGLNIKKKLAFIIIFLFIIITFTLGISWLFPASHFVERMAFFKNLGDVSFWDWERIYAWQASLDIIKDNPLTGIGPFNFEEIYPYYKPEEAELILAHPHNSFLDLAVSFGILALILFCVILFLFFQIFLKTISKVKDDRRIIMIGILSGLTGFLVHNLVDSLLIVSPVIAVFFWFLMGISVALSKTSQ